MVFYPKLSQNDATETIRLEIVYFPNMNNIFEIGVALNLKTLQTLNLQIVISALDTIFEFVGSSQTGKDILYIIFIKYS